MCKLKVGHIKLLLIALILMLGTLYTYGQLQLRHMPGMNNAGYIPQRTCFEINNAGMAIQSVISIKIKSVAGDSLVLELESPQMTIPTGNTQILPSILEQFKTIFIERRYFFIPLYLPKGNYMADVVIKQKPDDVEIAYLTIPIVVSLEDKTAKKENKYFSTYGNIQITGVLNSRKQSFSGLPQNYVQATFDPNFVICGLPVSVHATVSSLQHPGQAQNLNSFSINYNAAALKSLLTTKLQSAIEKNQNFENLNNIKESADINQYNNYKKVLENPAVKKELQELAKLDTNVSWNDSIGHLKSLYQNFIPTDTASAIYKKYKEISGKYSDTATAINEVYKFFTNDTSKIAAQRDSVAKLIAKAEKMKEKYNTLMVKRAGYEKMIKDKEGLEKNLQSLGILDSLGNTVNKDKINELKGNATSLKDNIDNPEYLKEQLKKHHLFRGIDNVMLIINKVNIGTSYPAISPLTLNGVRVNGLNVELTPKNIFVGVTYGTILDPVQTFNPTVASYKRKLWNTTFGYGKPDKSHMYFTIQNAADDSSSINPRDSIFATTKLPQSNYIISSHFKLQLFGGRLSLYGELAGSQTTRDVELDNPDSLTYSTVGPQGNPRQWMRNIFTQRTINTNTVTDHAYMGGIETAFFKGRTKINVAYKRIGADYQTFGIPFLINDMKTIEGKVTQKLWRGRILLAASVKHNTDNLNGAKLFTTKNYQFGGDIRIAIPKLPSIRASYVPVMMQNDSTRVTINILNISSNYQYKIGRIKNIVTAAYVQQHLTSTDVTLSYSSTNAMLSHTTFLVKNISVTGSVNYIRFNSQVQPNINTINIGASTSFGLFKNKLSNTVGATMIMNKNEKRYGFYYYAGYALNKYIATNLKLENNQYNSYTLNDSITIPYFSEFIAQLSIIIKW